MVYDLPLCNQESAMFDEIVRIQEQPPEEKTPERIWISAFEKINNIPSFNLVKCIHFFHHYSYPPWIFQCLLYLWRYAFSRHLLMVKYTLVIRKCFGHYTFFFLLNSNPHNHACYTCPKPVVQQDNHALYTSDMPNKLTNSWDD